MNKKLVLLLILLNVCCAMSAAYAMGSAPPPPTEVASSVPTASEEALAKEQVDNLRNISINSKDVQEAYGKFVKHMLGGKKYLYEFNDVAEKQLVKDALDKKQDWKYRFAIIGALNPDNPPEAFDLRVKILRDKSEKIELRRYAIGSIASTKRSVKKREAVDVLIESLKDDDWDIVASAANGLGELKDKKAVGPLIESVKRTRRHLDELLANGWKEYTKGTQFEDSALSCSIRALGDIKDKKAVPVLLDLLNDPYLEKVVELNDVTKGWALLALRDIDDKTVIGPIKEYRKTTRDYRVHGVASDAIKTLEKENGKGSNP
jgi:hypothetical protein